MDKTLNRFFKIFISIVLIIAQLQCVSLNARAASILYINIQSLLNVSIQSSSNAGTIVTLRWTEDRVSKRNYIIQRKTDNGDYPQNNTGTFAAYTSYPSPTADVPIYYNLSQDVIPEEPSGHIYTYRIIAVDNSGNYFIYSNEVTFSATDASKPLSLDLTPVSETQIDLVWTYPGTSSFDTIIERRRADGNDTRWYEIATVSKNTMKYSDLNLLQNTQYYYRIRATASNYVDSYRYPQNSADPYSTLGRTQYTLIPTPTELYGYVTAANSIKLSWKNNSSRTKTVIERKKQGEQNFIEAATILNDVSTYLDTNNIALNTWYTYRISAVDPNLDRGSKYSTEITISSNYVNEPTNLTATTNNDVNVELNWNDNSSNETSFEIWRKVGMSGIWEIYASVGSKVTRFIDKNADKDTLYFYKIRANVISSGAYSAYSNIAQTWSTLLYPPTELKADSTGMGKVTLTWKDNSNNESGFIVERKIGLESAWADYKTLPANIVTFAEIGLAANMQYYYRIRVYDNSSFNSYACSDDILFSTEAPLVPTGLSVKISSAGGVEVKWAASPSYMTGYLLEKKSGKSGVYSQIAEIGPNKTNYLDKSINYNAKYYYRIRAVNNYFYSGYSSEVLAVTGVKPVFSDVPYSHWGREAIENLSGIGVFNVPSGGKFNPQAKVTRGEFTSYLVKAFKLKATAVGSFYDVKANNKYYKEIMIANKMGIVTPNKDKYYYPNRFITREEMVVMIVKTLKVIDQPLPAQDIDILKAYPDNGAISSWALDSIAAAIGERIIVGKASNGFELVAPKTLGLRAEAALMIYKALNN